MGNPDPSQSDGAVVLPNGSTIRRGGRLRVPKELIWEVSVIEASEKYGWELDHSAASHSSEVIVWPSP